MKRNKLGKSDIHISQLTLGCMSLGTDIKKAKYIIDYALDQGINHLDTADLYDFGKNEEIIGEVIKEKRDQIILTSKVGNHFNSQTKTWFWDPSKQHIHQSIKDSLQRLQTDYLDFYMLHGGTIEDPIDETIEAFEQLKQEGLIRAYGISSIRPNVIREYIKRSSIDGVMMQYSLLDRRPEEELLDLLYKNEISVLARGPLVKGILTSEGFNQIEAKAKGGYLDYSHDELNTLLKKLATIAPANVSQLALRYVLTHPAVTSAVFGASSLTQIKEIISGKLEHKLSDDVAEQLKQLTKANSYQAHR